MKKIFLLTSLLCTSLLASGCLVSCTNNPFEQLAAKMKNGSLKDDDIEFISKTIKANIKRAAEIADKITITFEVKKDKEHNTESWQKMISEIADIMEKANDKDPDIMINELSDYMKNSKDLAGDETGIHGELSCKIGTPENWAAVKYTTD